MDKIKEDILEIVQKHASSISISKLMIEYFKITDKHLYLEVSDLGYDSVPHFLALIDELTLDMNNKETFDMHIRVNDGHKEDLDQEFNGSPIKTPVTPPTIDSPLDEQKLMPFMRSYETVKNDDDLLKQLPQQQQPGPSNEPDETPQMKPNDANKETVHKPQRRRFNKNRRRANHAIKPRRNVQDGLRQPGSSNGNAYRSQYHQDYNSYAPFDYRSWSGGQHYYDDAPQSTAIRPLLPNSSYMQNSSNQGHNVWNTRLTPFSYQSYSPGPTHWSIHDQNKPRKF